MFARLFAESGLSLDRLRALLEVGAAGSIVKAAAGDPVKQSQYSRQIKELEDFFRIKLVERHGKGIRLTASGKELARISRFFLLGLSNFQRGGLTEEQTFRIGASATFIECFLLPVLTDPHTIQTGPHYAVERAGNDEVEGRLHDLTLDFGVVSVGSISRPLQLREAGAYRLNLWVPKALCDDEREALRAFKAKRLPLVLAMDEPGVHAASVLRDYEARLICGSFLEAGLALKHRGVATILPDFLVPDGGASAFLRIDLRSVAPAVSHYWLAWNPRLIRLNPHAARWRDSLFDALARQMRR